MNTQPSNPFPSLEQELLLKASLLKGQHAIAAWKEWNQAVDPSWVIDRGSFRLLPQLFRNLEINGVKDGYTAKLHGVYRQSWYKNQRLIHDSSLVLKLLHEAGIKTLVLKGVAFSILYYRDMGARPMADIDILVPATLAQKAIAVMRNAGFKPEREEFLDYDLRYGKGMVFISDAGLEIDIHWYPFFEARGAIENDDFWTGSLPLELFNTQTYAFGPGLSILHSLLHGLKWNPEPPVRWVADVYKIIEATGDQMNWDELPQLAHHFRAGLYFNEAMSYMKEHFNVPVPEAILETSLSLRADLAERMVYKYNKQNPAEIRDNLCNRLWSLMAIYLQQSGEKNILAQLAGFIRYLAFRTAGKNRFRILAYFLKKAIRR